MRILITFFLFTSLTAVHAQEKINRFHIVDSVTRLAIPAVSIIIAKAKIAITTEKDGIFKTSGGDLSLMSDTIILNAQNYAILKIPLYKLDKLDTITLRKIIFEAMPLETNGKHDSLLNDFNRRNITHYAGLHTETAHFEFLQLAQQFDLPKSGVTLKNLLINRLAYVLNYGTGDEEQNKKQRDWVGMEYTTFRVRIYDLDSLTGGPGKDLCDQLIEVKDFDNKRLNVNLDKYKILIPNKTFFVAVEWLRDTRNMGYVLVYDEKIKKDVKFLNYRPAIALSPVKGNKLNMWVLNLKYEWMPFTYFSPHWTDLAIKATIRY